MGLASRIRFITAYPFCLTKMIRLIRFHGSQWGDLLLPLSLLGLLFERSGNPDGMVLLLFAWFFLKFWRHCPGQPLYVVLIGILSTILSTVINPISISAFFDLIPVLLAFAAGFGRQVRNEDFNLDFTAASFIVFAVVRFISLEILMLSHGSLCGMPCSRSCTHSADK